MTVRPVVTALLITACALSLRADSLVTLRTSLAVFRGVQPVSATVEVHRERKSSGRFSNSQSSGEATFGVDMDAAGLHLTIPPAMLEKADREEREHDADPKKVTPTRAAIDETQALSIIESLNFADSLVRMLAIGVVTSEKRQNWQGRPARLLALKLTEKLPPQATTMFNVQFADDHLNLWLADDNTPLAAERIRKGSARFLFLRGEMNSREAWNFVRRDDRLIVTRFEASFAGSGFGQKGEGKTVQTVTLR